MQERHKIHQIGGICRINWIMMLMKKILVLLACSGMAFGQTDGSTAVPAVNLLSEMMKLDASGLERFVEANQTNAIMHRRFDAMLKHIEGLDRDQILQLGEQGMDNGWPIDVVDGMFGHAFMLSCKDLPPTAKQILSWLKTPGVSQGRAFFLIQGAQREWAETWSEDEYDAFLPFAIDFATDATNRLETRSLVVDDLIRSLRLRLQGSSPSEAKEKLASSGWTLEMKLLDHEVVQGKDAYSNVRYAVQLYALLSRQPPLRKESQMTARCRFVFLLKERETPSSAVQEILKVYELLGLVGVLTIQDVESLKRDKRFADEESQSILDQLSDQLKRPGDIENKSGDGK